MSPPGTLSTYLSHSTLFPRPMATGTRRAFAGARSHPTHAQPPSRGGARPPRLCVGLVKSRLATLLPITPCAVGFTVPCGDVRPGQGRTDARHAGARRALTRLRCPAGSRARQGRSAIGSRKPPPTPASRSPLRTKQALDARTTARVASNIAKGIFRPGRCDGESGHARARRDCRHEGVPGGLR